MGSRALLMAAIAACAVLSLPARTAAQAKMDAARAAEMAISNSKDLSIGDASLNARSGSVFWAYRAFFPSLQIQYANNESISETLADDVSKSLTLTVAQLLWDGCRTATGIKLEAASIRLARAELARKALEVGDNAIALYRKVLMLRADREAAASALDAAKTQMGVVKKEKELGLARAMDIADIRVQEIETSIELAKTARELKEAERSLLVAVGGERLPELSESIDVSYRGVDVDIARIAGEAESRNPSIAQLEASVAEKRQSAALADASWWPTLSLKASGSVGGDAFPLTEAAWSASLSVDFEDPSLSGGSALSYSGGATKDRKAALSQNLVPLPSGTDHMARQNARIALESEANKLKLAKEQLVGSLESLTSDYRLKRDIRDLYEEKHAVVVSKRDLVMAKLDLGQATRSELVEADIDVFKAKIALISAANDLLASERSLESFLDFGPGGLVDFLTREKGR
jgi:outer membrane protein TolC